MVRPLRLEFAHALYHVTSRGDRREDIYHADTDRQAWLALLAQVCKRFNWTVHAYCLMSNHYRLLVKTPKHPLVRWYAPAQCNWQPHQGAIGRVA